MQIMWSAKQLKYVKKNYKNAKFWFLVVPTGFASTVIQFFFFCSNYLMGR